MSVAAADKTKPYIPLAGAANDGYSNDREATATCFCGAVQLAFVGFFLPIGEQENSLTRG